METFIMKACFTRLQSRRYTVYIRPYCIKLSWKPHTLFWDWMNASGYSDMRNNNKVIEQKKDAHRHWCQMLWHSHLNRRVPTLLLLIWNQASPIQARNFAENSKMNHINLPPWASPCIVKRGIFDAIFEFKQMLFAQMSVKLLATLYRNGIVQWTKFMMYIIVVALYSIATHMALSKSCLPNSFGIDESKLCGFNFSLKLSIGAVHKLSADPPN